MALRRKYIKIKNRMALRRKDIEKTKTKNKQKTNKN